MATKRELRAKAIDLAAKLGTALAVDFDRMNHAALVQLVSDLEAKAESTGDASSSSDALPVVAVDSGVTVVTPDDGETWNALAPAPEPPSDPEPLPAPPVIQDAPKTPEAPAVRVARPVRRGSVPSTVASVLDGTTRPVRSAAEYVVADGKAVTSPRGMLRAGKPVRIKDFHPDTLEKLIQTGAIIPRET